MAFVRRALDFRFNLGVNVVTKQAVTPFKEGGNQVYLSGMRASADIEIAGGLSMGTASIAIYGMTLSLMNQLSTLGVNPRIIGPNFVSVLAYKVGEQPSMIYQGAINNAWMDGEGQPNVPLRVEASAGAYEASAPFKPHSYPAAVSAAVVIQTIATEIGRSFTNYGVNVMLPPGAYFHGSARNQAYACAAAAGCAISFDISKNNPGNGVIIYPKNKAIGTESVLVSADTGMRGYPTYTSRGIAITTEFNPAIGYWSTLNVQSSLQPACGKWIVNGLSHNLDSITPQGSWFSHLQAIPPGSSSASPGFNPLAD